MTNIYIRHPYNALLYEILIRWYLRKTGSSAAYIMWSFILYECKVTCKQIILHLGGDKLLLNEWNYVAGCCQET